MSRIVTYTRMVALAAAVALAAGCGTIPARSPGATQSPGTTSPRTPTATSRTPRSTPTETSTPTGTSSPGPTSTVTVTSPPGATTPVTAPPQDVVIAYFAAIRVGDYQKAWDLGGKNTTSSYASFVDGFKTTADVSAHILDVHGDDVTAQVTTQEEDGSSKVFEGTYTVRDGVIVKFNVRQVS